MPYQPDNSYRPDDNTQLNIPDFLLNPTVSRRVEDRPPAETRPRHAAKKPDATPVDDTTDTIEDTNAKTAPEAPEAAIPEVEVEDASEVDAETIEEDVEAGVDDGAAAEAEAELDEVEDEPEVEAEVEAVEEDLDDKAEAENEVDTEAGSEAVKGDLDGGAVATAEAEPVGVDDDEAEVEPEAAAVEEGDKVEEGDETEDAPEADPGEADADIEDTPAADAEPEDNAEPEAVADDEAVKADGATEAEPEVEDASPVVEQVVPAISAHEAEIEAMMESVMRAVSMPARRATNEQETEKDDATSSSVPAEETSEAARAPQHAKTQNAPSDYTLPRITLETEHRPLPRRQTRTHGYVSTRDIIQGSPLPESDSQAASDIESLSPNAQEIAAAQEQLAALQRQITQAQEALQELASQPEEQPEPEPEPPVPTLEEDLATMERIERRIFAHRYASTELDAYGASIDPSKATADRSEALAVLAEEDHELLSAPGVGEAIERLCSRADELEPIVATQVKVLAKDRKQLVSVPADVNSELVRLTAESYDVWVRARKMDDWASFAPYLDRLVDIKRKVALARDPEAHPYDTLLDEFEPGTNRTFYNSFFARVKQSVVPLLSSISMSGQIMSRACVEGHFDERRQWDLAEDICAVMGIDESAHYLTSTVHPFSEAMTSNYAITASHIVGDNLMSNVYTMLHELGHNLYEQGVNPEFNRTSLKGGTSSGMHEAQSRFFENCVGRDRAFMVPLLGLMRNRFPGQLSRVTPNQLYRAVNQVSASLIRVDADEVSYPLHILVRYEIEKMLFEGKATANEVPKLWGDLYDRYIGVRPTTDADGALQDVHWAVGEFGYFPSYALGNAYAAQLRAKMIDEGMDWNALLRAGDLEPIRAWLKDRIWQYGRSREPRQLIEDACGEPFSPRHYANYLTDKYVALYGLGRA